MSQTSKRVFTRDSQAPEADVRLNDLLGPDHKGMRVSASGLLGRIRDKWKMEDHQRYVAGELLRHLEELAERFYGGDVKAVDEFLQLYDLDDNRP